MPPRKQQPLDNATLAPRIPPERLRGGPRLECGCLESAVDTYYSCLTCRHRRCLGHRATHDSKACAADAA